MKLPSTLSLLLLLWLLAPAFAQPAPAPHAGDTNVVNFVLPGHFADALAAAKQQNRCLMIKGVAFGVDAEGAVCATKGHW
ncbi:MAG: hypothetical protein AB7K09_06910 [Planctomycetota bacterium]